MPVYFFRVEDWKQGKAGKFTYKLDANIDFSTWDWIGLYKVSLTHQFKVPCSFIIQLNIATYLQYSSQ